MFKSKKFLLSFLVKILFFLSQQLLKINKQKCRHCLRNNIIEVRFRKGRSFWMAETGKAIFFEWMAEAGKADKLYTFKRFLPWDCPGESMWAFKKSELMSLEILNPSSFVKTYVMFLQNPVFYETIGKCGPAFLLFVLGVIT